MIFGKKASAHDDLTALWTAQQRETSGRTTASRRRKEKKPLSSTDGRVRRGLGRDRQYNTNVTQEIIDLVADACERFDLTKAELTDRALRTYIEALKAGACG